MINEKKIKYAIIGCGRISARHFESIHNDSRSIVYAACDIDKNKLINVKKKYPKVKLYNNFLDALNDKNVDVVNICTPSGIHSKMALLAAKHGKNVIIEKPMAMNKEDAEKIIQSFNKNGKKLCVVLQNRFNPAVQTVLNKINELGRLNYIAGSVFWYRDQSYYNDGWHGTKKMDGGVLLNQSVHFVDMIQFLSKKNIEAVSAYASTTAHKMECEDVITVNFRFSDGTLGNLQANTISYPENYEGSIILFFEKATIKIGGSAMNEITYWNGSVKKEKILQKSIQKSNIYGGGHNEVIKNFNDSILKNTKILIDGLEGIKSIKIIDAIYKSIKNKKEIVL